MSGMEGLGRVFNVVPVADAVEVSLKEASAVSFVCVGANAETFTVEECTSAAGAGAVTLSTVTHYYTNANSGGTAAWGRSPSSGESAATGVVTTTTAAPVAVITITNAELSDGFTYIRCSSSSTGTVVAVTHDLAVQRKPSNLVAPGV